MTRACPTIALITAASLLVGLGLTGCTAKDDGPRKRRPGTTDSTPVPLDTGTPPPAGVPVTVQASGPVQCAEPSLRLSKPFDRVLAPAEAPKDSWFWGGGVVIADFTGDAVLDIALPGYHGTTFHVGQPDGGFVPDARLDALPVGFASGGSAADYDGDGDFDLLITRYLLPDKLLRNDGGLFTDVSDEAGISPAMTRSMATTWGDVDGDGDLDLFVGSYGYIDESGVDHADFLPADPAFLYLNDGDGTFTDASDTLPQVVHDGYTFAASFVDLDLDGLPELYVVNDFGVAFPNSLLLNRGGTLELDDGSSGLHLDITGMGLGMGDLNQDGQADFVMPEWNGIVVMESSPIGTWVQTGFARGIYNDINRNQKVGWGADVVDIDNDRDLDVPIVFGYLLTELYDAPQDEKDALFVQDEDGAFQDLAEAYGFDDPTDGRGFVTTDLNGDGWLDIVKRDLQGPTILNQSRCGAEHWTKLQLVQDGANRFGIGARIRVFAGGDRMVRYLRAGGLTHASGGPPIAHFGLGDADVIDRIEVTWPDGSVSNLWDQPADRTLTLTRE